MHHNLALLFLAEGNPYTWWVGKANEKHYYWGGSGPGIQKCACGIERNCTDPKYYCNCDADYKQWWVVYKKVGREWPDSLNFYNTAIILKAKIAKSSPNRKGQHFGCPCNFVSIIFSYITIRCLHFISATSFFFPQNFSILEYYCCICL